MVPSDRDADARHRMDPRPAQSDDVPRVTSPEREKRRLRRLRPTGATRERSGHRSAKAAILVGLGVLCAASLIGVAMKSADDAAAALREAAQYTPPPQAIPSEASADALVVLIGDETVSQAATSVSSDERWPNRLANSTTIDVSQLADSSAGYTARGAEGTFEQQASEVPIGADVVVFFGGAADAKESQMAVAKAATNAFALAHARAPNAKLVVVGPVIDGVATPVQLNELRNTLRSSTAIVGATWVDPMVQPWLTRTTDAARSASSLTTKDESRIATEMRAVLNSVLGR